ncbi:hypothetical protein T4B_6157 [Trichinella pseudospiralis]|uniref:Uncharacterized protein n=1 Tax=Trichinella pseudospiralis TaxID=6337 RepID=A0A0V1IJM4_TRIPS|nr:hypothetical protein T4B_6157 [Trichinella pseudospiralis]
MMGYEFLNCLFVLNSKFSILPIELHLTAKRCKSERNEDSRELLQTTIKKRHQQIKLSQLALFSCKNMSQMFAVSQLQYVTIQSHGIFLKSLARGCYKFINTDQRFDKLHCWLTSAHWMRSAWIGDEKTGPRERERERDYKMPGGAASRVLGFVRLNHR